MDVLGTLSSWVFQFPVSLALAVVAALGYLLGRRTGAVSNVLPPQSRRELRRAQQIGRAHV